MIGPRVVAPPRTDGWEFVRNVVFNAIYQSGGIDPFQLENDIERVWGYTVNGRWVHGLTATSMASVLRDGVDPTTEDTRTFEIEHVDTGEGVELSRTITRPVGVWASTAQYQYPEATPHPDKQWLGSDLTIRVNTRGRIRDGKPSKSPYATETVIDAVGRDLAQQVVGVLQTTLDFDAVDVLFSGVPGVYTVIVSDLHVKHLDTENRDLVGNLLTDVVDVDVGTVGVDATTEVESGSINTLTERENWIRAPQTPHSATGLLSTFVSDLDTFDPFESAVSRYRDIPELPETIPVKYPSTTVEETVSVGSHTCTVIPGEREWTPIEPAIYAISLGVAEPLVTNDSSNFTQI